MGELNPLELSVLEKLLTGAADPFPALQRQLKTISVASRENTGVGFFTKLIVPPEESAATGIQDGPYGDVEAQIDGLQNGAGFLLWIKEGRLDMLEGFSYDEPWPHTVGSFALRYHKEPRALFSSPS